MSESKRGGVGVGLGVQCVLGVGWGGCREKITLGTSDPPVSKHQLWRDTVPRPPAILSLTLPHPLHLCLTLPYPLPATTALPHSPCRPWSSLPRSIRVPRVAPEGPILGTEHRWL